MRYTRETKVRGRKREAERERKSEANGHYQGVKQFRENTKIFIQQNLLEIKYKSKEKRKINENNKQPAIFVQQYSIGKVFCLNVAVNGRGISAMYFIQ